MLSILSAAPVPSVADAPFLGAIPQPGLRLASLRRSLPRAVRRAASVLAETPFSLTAEDRPAAAAALVAEAAPRPLGLALRLDIRRLAQGFAELIGSDIVRIRLEALVGDGCARWHADAVGLRLLCTYHGPGTEWLDLPGGAATARALPIGGFGAGARRLRAGDVAILKGEDYPGQAGQGCIHRSPPRRGRADARLLLCIDEPGRIPLA